MNPRTSGVEGGRAGGVGSGQRTPAGNKGGQMEGWRTAARKNGCGELWSAGSVSMGRLLRISCASSSSLSGPVGTPAFFFCSRFKENQRQEPLPGESLIPIFPYTCLPPSVPLRASARLHCFAYVDLWAYALIGHTPRSQAPMAEEQVDHMTRVCDGGAKRGWWQGEMRGEGEGGGGVS